ncbi:MAG TPA: AI-2E family transporter, partial [Bradyrhizobium sp.]|nr:AI-2E family transporter [Bradyrhizobium sp.]
AMVCLSYLDVSSPAHMRFAVRRLRTKFPRAVIMLGVWSGALDGDGAGQLRDAAKADFASATLHAALEVCIEAGRAVGTEVSLIPEQPAVAV